MQKILFKYGWLIFIFLDVRFSTNRSFKIHCSVYLEDLEMSDSQIV